MMTAACYLLLCFIRLIVVERTGKLYTKYCLVYFIIILVYSKKVCAVKAAGALNYLFSPIKLVLVLVLLEFGKWSNPKKILYRTLPYILFSTL